MIAWRIGLVLVVAAACAALGYVMPSPMGMSVVTPQAGIQTSVFVHPGAVLAEAARRMHGAEVEDGAMMDEVDLSIDVTPPAAPIDVADLFRREMAAIVIEAASEPVVLVGTGSQARRLAVGSVYQDGWRVKAIESSEIVLARRADVRRIAVIGDVAVAPVASSADPMAAQGAAPRRMTLTRQDARGSMP
ncbi:MAG: hypothetical protein NW200_03205 [Hyphomonadaceae bacterium]|nr:hypothetical protein [Hyphomonadaceae bacterium]